MKREISYRIDVLRNGAKLTELLWSEESPPNVYIDTTGDIKGSLSGTFRHNPVVDYIADDLQPWIGINGEWAPLGVFRIATLTEQEDASGHWIEAEAYDRCWMLQTMTTEGIMHIPAGTAYLTKIEELLIEAGIGLVVAAPTDAILQTDREDWQEGTPYLTIVNQLMDEINYKQIWFDGNGVAHLEPVAQASAANIKWSYSAEDVILCAPVSPELTQEFDVFSAPNVFVAICSNPDLEAPLVARAENNNPSSATSVFRRGQRITQLLKVDNIASQEALQAYVDDICFQSLFSHRVVTFETLAEGGHGAGDILSLGHKDMGGIFEETAWYITMTPGEFMKHTAKRTVIA